MSLFASSFESPGASRASGASVIGSTSAGAAPGLGGNKHKRKRPSHGGSGAGAGGGEREWDAQLGQARVNLEKLMRRVERGEVEEHAGREGMGGGKGAGAGKGKGKADKGAAQPEKSKGKPSAHGGAQQHTSKKGGEGKSKGKGKGENKGKGTSKDGGGVDARPPKKAKHAVAPARTEPAAPASAPACKPVTVELVFDLAAQSPRAGKKAKAAGAGAGAAGSAAASGMTDLQRAMASKLEGARFRWINEKLYAVPSAQAVEMMRADPQIFADYHETHRALTAGWPSPPLPLLVARLAALPAGALVVDLGCGDAGLARALVPRGINVLSYDLVGDVDADTAAAAGGGDGAGGAQGGWVVAADFLTRIPLPGRPGGHGDDEAADEDTGANEGKGAKHKGKKGKRSADGHASEVVDAAVCCLSLMGTNWLGGIYEACRVLKQGGALHIAEVTSRFVDVDAFVAAIVSFGFALVSQDAPSTHFTLFEFTKARPVPRGPVRGQAGWDARVRAGEAILRGCVYKKR
ncbi:25S rRNA (adenine645-N1)-methyltransferase [Cryptotrichosporon argae]